ncbi:MAG: sugar phosphate isomerase/epimerase [Oscillospiraceae bacterium]|nr:sugar phosphate isomerase/epimerase [Oscillospiraceae bacterium]
MPTLIEMKSLESCAALCRELGLSFVELSMDMPEYQANRLDIEELRQIADNYGVFYTIHLSGFLNPCDFNDKVAAVYTETVLEMIEATKQLTVPVLNMHLPLGDYFTLPDRKVCLFDEYEPEYLGKLVAFRDACVAKIDDHDIKICVENTRAFQQEFGQRGLSVLLESEVFAVTFDIGHDAGNDFKQRPLIDRHIDRLYHMHIHDAKGKENHLPLGEGDLDIIKYLDLAKLHECCAVLEVKTVDGLRQSATWLKERYWI